MTTSFEGQGAGSIPVFDTPDRLRKSLSHSGTSVSEMADYLAVVDLNHNVCQCHIVTSTPDLVPTRVVCEILGVTPSGVSRMVSRGTLKPVIKTPGDRGAFLFARPDIDALRESRAAEQANA